MKPCPNCQTENLDVAWKCKSCGAELPSSQENDFGNPYGLAKTSLIFGCLAALIVPTILGSLLNSLMATYVSMVSFGIVAVVTGVKALSRIKKRQEKKGQGMAIAGIVLGGLFSILAVCSFAGIVLGPMLQEQFNEIQRSLGTPAP
nr:DUF4190 domain-containing protein [Chloroflexota bacterium]